MSSLFTFLSRALKHTFNAHRSWRFKPHNQSRDIGHTVNRKYGGGGRLYLLTVMVMLVGIAEIAEAKKYAPLQRKYLVSGTSPHMGNYDSAATAAQFAADDSCAGTQGWRQIWTNCQASTLPDYFQADYPWSGAWGANLTAIIHDTWNIYPDENGSGSLAGTISLECPAGYVRHHADYCWSDFNYLDLFKNQVPDSCSAVGNPISPAIGNKFEVQTDLESTNASSLSFRRYYSSSNATSARMGDHWRHTFERSIVGGGSSTNFTLPPFNSSGSYTTAAPVADPSPISVATIQNLATIVVYRQMGQAYPISYIDGAWKADADVNLSIVRLADGTNQTTGWQIVDRTTDERESYDVTGKLRSITNRDGVVQTLAYDGNGRLVTVTDSFGRQLTFTYFTSNRIATVTDPNGQVYSYAYDGAGNLSSVTYPDTTPAISTDNPKRIYLYNEQIYTANTNLPMP
jgi:YD repeat-containing protein